MARRGSRSYAKRVRVEIDVSGNEKGRGGGIATISKQDGYTGYLGTLRKLSIGRLLNMNRERGNAVGKAGNRPQEYH